MRAMLFYIVITPFNFAADDDAAKRKAAVADAVVKLALKNTVTVATADLIVISTLPEAKAKALAEVAQKALAVARENLKFAKDESPFGGPLPLYAFSENADLKKYLRLIEQRRSDAETHVLSLRGATPYVLVSLDPGAKLVESELNTLAGAWAAAAALNKKAGAGDAKIPDWLLAGYGRACVLRAEPITKQSTTRTKIKSLVSGKKTPVWAKDIWSADKLPERDLIGASFVEYLAFGPYSEKFVAFTRANKPLLDADNPPGPDAAAQASYELKLDELDLAWKQWVVKGK